jgi:hypothetical protein
MREVRFMVEDSEPATGGTSEADILAESIQRDAVDADTFFGTLVGRLVRALGPRVRVQQAPGLLRRVRPVIGVRVDLTTTGSGVILRARRAGRNVACSVTRPVLGVVVGERPVTVSEWCDALADALIDEAAHSRSARHAMQILLTRAPTASPGDPPM